MADRESDIYRHFDTILETDQQTVGRMPESVFQTYLLPALLGQSENKIGDLWLPAAGSWQRPIDVYDDNTQEHLFRVPALVGDININENQEGISSAYEIIMEARRKMQTMPAKVGEEFLNRRIRRYIQPCGKRRENLYQWNWILSRYGYDHYVNDPYGDLKNAQSSPDKNTTTSITSNSDNNRPQILGYEEL